MILRHILIGDSSFHISQLKITNFLPVYYMSMQIKTAIFYNLFNITDCKFAIPAGVHMHNQWAQAKILDLYSKIGTIYAATKANDAVIILT